MSTDLTMLTWTAGLTSGWTLHLSLDTRPDQGAAPPAVPACCLSKIEYALACADISFDDPVDRSVIQNIPGTTRCIPGQVAKIAGPAFFLSAHETVRLN